MPFFNYKVKPPLYNYIQNNAFRIILNDTYSIIKVYFEVMLNSITDLLIIFFIIISAALISNMNCDETLHRSLDVRLNVCLFVLFMPISLCMFIFE